MCLFGGVRVPDGTISLFTVEKKKVNYMCTFLLGAFFTVKKNDKIQAHIFGGGRVSDGFVSLIAVKKKTTKYKFTFLVG